MRRIYTGGEVTQCAVRKAVLESCGIACEVRNEGLAQLYGEIPFSQVWPELWVFDDARYEEACAILERSLPSEPEQTVPRPAPGDSDQQKPPVGLRDEEADDAESIRDVLTVAFGRSAEAEAAESLRRRGCVTLALVAAGGPLVVGYALFTPVSLDPPRGVAPWVGLAPLAVLPEYQCFGIGSWLVIRGLDRLRAAGVPGVVVLGNPAFYGRFGFQPASRLGLRSEYDVSDEEFMAQALDPGAPAQPPALVRYQPEFRLL
jgi:putative acetyltransferase